MADKILIADDSTTIQKVVDLAFSHLSYEVVKVQSFDEANLLFENSPSLANDCKLIIADSKLPGTNNLSDYSLLSKMAGFVPIILLNGSFDHIDQNKLESAGFKFVLKKPFDSEELVTMSLRLMGSEAKLFHKPGAQASKSKNVSNKIQDDFISKISLKQKKIENNINLSTHAIHHKLKGRPAFVEENNENFSAGLQNRFLEVEKISLAERDEIKKIVQDEVKDFCEKEFKNIAMDVIKNELQRLAGERSRYLIDQ